MTRNYFEFLNIIGKGGFGKVWKVKLKRTKEIFALKEMSKVKIIDRRSEESIMNERKLLSRLNNPFIVNMYFSFQDFSNLYLVMDYLKGGDLRYHIAKNKFFTEQQTKFFLSNIIIGLSYIHSKNIIHRDIKPENLVCDSNGYVRITDFGVAKKNEKDNSSETSGTPGYMAPEVMLLSNHSFPVDYYAIGIIGFEFCFGFRPYLGRSRKEIRDLIVSRQVKINNDDIPDDWSIESADFINQLIERKECKRLGFKNGIKDLMEHKWMKDVDWDKIRNKELIAPFIPDKKKDNFDRKYCESKDQVDSETLFRYNEYINHERFPDLFKDYSFVNYFPHKSIFCDNNNFNNKDFSNSNNDNHTKVKSLGNTNSMINMKLSKNESNFFNTGQSFYINNDETTSSEIKKNESLIKSKNSYKGILNKNEKNGSITYRINNNNNIGKKISIISEGLNNQIMKNSTPNIFKIINNKALPIKNSSKCSSQRNIEDKDINFKNKIMNIIHSSSNINKNFKSNNALFTHMKKKSLEKKNLIKPLLSIDSHDNILNFPKIKFNSKRKDSQKNILTPSSSKINVEGQGLLKISSKKNILSTHSLSQSPKNNEVLKYSKSKDKKVKIKAINKKRNFKPIIISHSNNNNNNNVNINKKPYENFNSI